MKPDTELQQGTKTQISQAVGISLVTAFGALAAASFLFFGSTKQTVSTNITTFTTDSTTIATKDLSTDAVPVKEVLADSGFSTKASTAPVALDTSVIVAITSPIEGAQANGDTTVTAELTDPKHLAAGVRILLYGAMLPDYMQGVASSVVTTAPYTFKFNLGLYPSGEYRYVAQAVKFDSTIPGADTSVVLATSDTMVTWVRSCYYLGYQDMTLNAPATSVAPGKSFTLTGSIKNNMRGACKNIYDIGTVNYLTTTSLLPDGWVATIAPPTPYDMGIGETKQFTVTINVPVSTTAATYQVGVGTRRQLTGFIVTKSVGVTVAAPISSGGAGNKTTP